MTVVEALRQLEKVNVTLDLVEEAMIDKAKELSLKTAHEKSGAPPQETATSSTQEHSSPPSCQESFSDVRRPSVLGGRRRRRVWMTLSLPPPPFPCRIE